MKPWLKASALTLVLNFAFLAISFSATLVPQVTIAERVRQAFASGELGESDYLRYDANRGSHQYNDCNILQMMSNPDASRAGRAWGPWIHYRNSSASDACATLRALVVDGRNRAEFLSERHTRYWHGYIPVLSALLFVTDISSARRLLQASTYASVLILLLAGFRQRRFLPLTGAVAFGGLFFWGLPYFGQGFSHAPGDTMVMLGIASLVFWPRRLTRTGLLLPFCAGFGAIIVYFEMLTGPLPTAAGLLFPTVYLVSRVANTQDDRVWVHLKHATGALTAFGLGATITLAARIGLAALAVEPSGLNAFFGNLAAYTAGTDGDFPLPAFFHPLVASGQKRSGTHLLEPLGHGRPIPFFPRRLALQPMDRSRQGHLLGVVGPRSVRRRCGRRSRVVPPATSPHGYARRLHGPDHDRTRLFELGAAILAALLDGGSLWLRGHVAHHGSRLRESDRGLSRLWVALTSQEEDRHRLHQPYATPFAAYRFTPAVPFPRSLAIPCSRPSAVRSRLVGDCIHAVTDSMLVNPGPIRFG